MRGIKVPFRSVLEKVLFQVDQTERRAQFFRDAALIHASLGNPEKAREMLQQYAHCMFPEIQTHQAEKDAMAEDILKRLPDSIQVFPAGGVSFNQEDVLKQHRVSGAGFDDTPIEHKIEINK